MNILLLMNCGGREVLACDLCTFDEPAYIVGIARGPPRDHNDGQ